MNNTSETNWDRVDALTEGEIDTSDIPPITEEQMSRSRWWKPVNPLNVLVEVDQHMAAALKIYADAQKTTASMRQSA
jgi:hypothetical protein